MIPHRPSVRSAVPALAVTALAVPALALLALASACGGSEAPKDQAFASVKKREPTPVLVEAAVRREMVRKLETTSRIESESHVQVYPRAGGVVTELLVEEGDLVAAGQVLARLDDRDAKLRLEDARASWDEAKANVPKLELATAESQARMDNAKRTADQAGRDHERNQALAAGADGAPKLIAQKDLEASSLARDKAWNDYETAKLAYERSKVERQNGDTAVERARVATERAELELGYTSLTAPVAGVVAERSIKTGDTIGNSTLAFVITDPTRLRTVFHRPQRELAMFHGALQAPGNGSDGPLAEVELYATAEAMPGKRFRGRIERISPTIDVDSGNFRITARMEAAAEGDPKARLVPGMLVRLEIVTDRHPEALVVPKRSIRREGDRSTIFVVEDGKARSVEVVESFADDESVEVTAANGGKLDAGAKVVVVGNRDLEEGAEVELAGSEASRKETAEKTAPPAEAPGTASSDGSAGAGG
jgi:membrane fusion protein, multidrug efflux system